jgi:hypothetical protein
MGTIAFLGQLPVFLLTPIAGVFADRVQSPAVYRLDADSVDGSIASAWPRWRFFFGQGAHPDMHMIVPGLIGLAAFRESSTPLICRPGRRFWSRW